MRFLAVLVLDTCDHQRCKNVYNNKDISLFVIWTKQWVQLRCWWQPRTRFSSTLRPNSISHGPLFRSAVMWGVVVEWLCVYECVCVCVCMCVYECVCWLPEGSPVSLHTHTHTHGEPQIQSGASVSGGQEDADSGLCRIYRANETRTTWQWYLSECVYCRRHCWIFLIEWM